MCRVERLGVFCMLFGGFSGNDELLRVIGLEPNMCGFRVVGVPKVRGDVKVINVGSIEELMNLIFNSDKCNEDSKDVEKVKTDENEVDAKSCNCSESSECDTESDDAQAMSLAELEGCLYDVFDDIAAVRDLGLSEEVLRVALNDLIVKKNKIIQAMRSRVEFLSTTQV